MVLYFGFICVNLCKGWHTYTHACTHTLIFIWSLVLNSYVHPHILLFPCPSSCPNGMGKMTMFLSTWGPFANGRVLSLQSQSRGGGGHQRLEKPGPLPLSSTWGLCLLPAVFVCLPAPDLSLSHQTLYWGRPSDTYTYFTAPFLSWKPLGPQVKRLHMHLILSYRPPGSTCMVGFHSGHSQPGGVCRPLTSAGAVSDTLPTSTASL